MTPFDDGTDLLDPRSRHNYHVTSRDDVPAVEPWTPDDLYRAVRRADDVVDGVVVLDYGRATLYLAAGTDLRYDPPRGLGVVGSPALHVADPATYDPATASVVDGPDRVTVAPTFDLLVPAFEFPADVEEAPPPLGGHRAGAPTGTGAGRGTPG